MRIAFAKAVRAPVVAAAVCAASAPPVDAAPPSRSVMDYKVYFGGFAAAALSVDLERARDDYRMRVTVRTLGVIDRFFPWTLRAYSRGRLAGAVALPEAAGQTSDWRGRRRLVDMSYDAGRPVVRRLIPTPGDDERDPVAAANTHGTVDLASAVLSMTLAAERGRGCAEPVRIFDGRRRYDLVAERLGEERIRHIGRTRHDTTALKCRISMVRLGGFKRADERARADARRRGAVVWVARTGHALPPLPIRVEVDTRWGTIIGHLVRVRDEPAGAE